MTEQTTTTTEQPDAEASRIASIDQKIAAAKDEILGEVRKLVSGAREGGSAQSAAEQHEAGKLGQPTRSLDQMIADAIKVNDDAKAREAAAKSTDDRLTAIEAATAEKPPVERGRLHKAMGWGEPAR